MSDSDGGYSAGKVADAIREGDVDALYEAFLADDEDVADLLLRLERAYDEDGDGPEDVRDTPLWQILARPTTTESLRNARQDGDVDTLSASTGITDGNDVEMAEWRRYEQLKDLFRQEPRVNPEFTNNIFQCIIFSSKIPPTGRGKSNTMYTLVEFAEVVHPDLRVMSNNTSDPYETVSEQWSDIEQSIREYDGWQILLIDEAAQFLQYADQGAGKTVSQMLKLLRHNHCHLIMVGHTGMDIPADIRRQVFVLDKKSQKKGILGYGIKPQQSGDRMQVAEKVMTLNSIPETTVEYDDIDDEGIEIKFGDEAGDADEDVAPQCRATTRTGDPCPNDAKVPEDDPKYCVNHRNRLDE